MLGIRCGEKGCGGGLRVRMAMAMDGRHLCEELETGDREGEFQGPYRNDLSRNSYLQKVWRLKWSPPIARWDFQWREGCINAPTKPSTPKLPSLQDAQ